MSTEEAARGTTIDGKPATWFDPQTPIDVAIGFKWIQQEAQKTRKKGWSQAKEEKLNAAFDAHERDCWQMQIVKLQTPILKKKLLELSQLEEPSSAPTKISESDLGLTIEDAHRRMRGRKGKKEEDATGKEQQKEFLQVWCTMKNEKHAEGIIAWKQERARLRKFKLLTEHDITIPPEWFNPIPDSEAIWKATDVTWLAKEEAKWKKRKGTEGKREIIDDEQVVSLKSDA